MPLRDRPVVVLEAIDRHEVVLRITVVPEHPGDGPQLASVVLEALSPLMRGAERVEGAGPVAVT